MKNLLPEKILTQRVTPRTVDMRGPYFRDQTAIIHSTAFRRLKHKTQVFFAPENDHVCTRIEHVLHVATIAATICKGLNSQGWSLSTEMAYAAGLGHDLGHAPFGHSGESVLSKKLESGFSHENHSLRVVDTLARNGKGLNLTYAVRDAILCHNGEKFEQYLEPTHVQENLINKQTPSRMPSTWEGCFVRISDKIAYLGRDIEDALTVGIINHRDIPNKISNHLGDSNGEIINTLVIDVIENTAKTGKAGFSDEKYDLMVKLRNFNYSNIYHHESFEYFESDCLHKLNTLFDYFSKNYDKILNGKKNKEIDLTFCSYLNTMDKHYFKNVKDKNVIITDYLSGMTDNYALASYDCLLR